MFEGFWGGAVDVQMYFIFGKKIMLSDVTKHVFTSCFVTAMQILLCWLSVQLSGIMFFTRRGKNLYHFKSAPQKLTSTVQHYFIPLPECAKS